MAVEATVKPHMSKAPRMTLARYLTGWAYSARHGNARFERRKRQGGQPAIKREGTDLKGSPRLKKEREKKNEKKAQQIRSRYAPRYISCVRMLNRNEKECPTPASHVPYTYTCERRAAT